MKIEPNNTAPVWPIAALACIMRIHEVEKTIGLSKSTIYFKLKNGDFPAPVQLSERAVGWRSQDIAAWLAGREAVSSTKRGVAK